MFSCEKEGAAETETNYAADTNNYREAFINAPIVDAKLFKGTSSHWWNFGSRFIDSLVAKHPRSYAKLDNPYNPFDENPVLRPYRLGYAYGTVKGHGEAFIGCFWHWVESGIPSKSIYEFAIPRVIKNIIIDEGVRIYLSYYECIDQPIEYINSNVDPIDVFVKSDNTKFSVEEFSRMFRKINTLDESEYWNNRVCFTDIKDRGNDVFWKRFSKGEYKQLSSFDEYDNYGIRGGANVVHHFQKSYEKCNPPQLEY